MRTAGSKTVTATEDHFQEAIVSASIPLAHRKVRRNSDQQDKLRRTQMQDKHAGTLQIQQTHH